MRIVSEKVEEKIRTYFIIINIFHKSYRLLNNAKKYVRAKQATNDNKRLGRKDSICV